MRNKLLNNKGFTMVEILGVIVIIGILTGIAIVAVSRYKEKAVENDYEALQTAIKNASDEYIMDHPYSEEFTFQDLLDGQYISNLTDPLDKNQVIRGKVKVSRNSTTSDGSLSDVSYTINYCSLDSFKTYESTTGTYSFDNRCKVDPYRLEDVPDIKVLNVYPTSGADNLKSWMDSYGKDKIHVDKVLLSTFNENPSNYLGTSGNWKYDEIVFGFWDCNASKDLSKSAASLVEEYLKEGNSAIFGHDTLTVNGCGSHTNFNTLASYVGLTLQKDKTWKAVGTVKIAKKGIFTTFPWDIGGEGTIMNIPNSHVYGQVASGDVWITFEGYSGIDSNKVYLSTYGNNAFIQTGHSNGKATEDEQKIIANIIFYMVAKQYVDDVD